MPKFLLIISILLHCVIISNAQTKEPNAATASISGAITLDGKPVRGAMIKIAHQDRDGNSDTQALSTRSDPSGYYRITAIKGGQHIVSVDAPPLVAKYEVVPWGRFLNISNGENIDNVNFELTRGGVITGTIFDPDGHPLIEEHLEIKKFNDEGIPKHFWEAVFIDNQLTTDDRGVYRLYGLPKGRYIISMGVKNEPKSFFIRSDSQYYTQTFYGDTDDEAKAKVIEILEGTEATNIDIRVKKVMKLYRVQGRITNMESGNPIPGVTLSIGSISINGPGNSEMVAGFYCSFETSNEQGIFKFNGISPGKYAVIYSRGCGPSNPKSPWIDYYSPPAIIEVINSDIHDAEVKIRRASTVSGNFIIEGQQSESINFSQLQLTAESIINDKHHNQLNTNQHSLAKITPEGRFSFSGLMPGRIQIRFNRNNERSPFIFDRIEYNGKRILLNDQDGIEITPGVNISDVRIFLKQRGTLKLNGELKIINGDLPDKMLLVPVMNKIGEDKPFPDHYGLPDARGKFTIEHLSEGEYEISLMIDFDNKRDSEEYKKLQRIIEKVKQKITISNGPPQTVVLMVDLGAKN